MMMGLVSNVYFVDTFIGKSPCRALVVTEGSISEMWIMLQREPVITARWNPLPPQNDEVSLMIYFKYDVHVHKSLCPMTLSCISWFHSAGWEF